MLWAYLLSRNVRVGAGRRSSLWLAVRRHVQEIPDQDGVVVRTADDLKLVKLQAENTARVLLQKKKKEGKKERKKKNNVWENC